jgi:hypothetical protein
MHIPGTRKSKLYIQYQRQHLSRSWTEYSQHMGFHTKLYLTMVLHSTDRKSGDTWRSMAFSPHCVHRATHKRSQSWNHCLSPFLQLEQRTEIWKNNYSPSSWTIERLPTARQKLHQPNYCLTEQFAPSYQNNTLHQNQSTSISWQKRMVTNPKKKTRINVGDLVIYNQQKKNKFPTKFNQDSTKWSKSMVPQLQPNDTLIKLPETYTIPNVLISVKKSDNTILMINRQMKKRMR